MIIISACCNYWEVNIIHIIYYLVYIILVNFLKEFLKCISMPDIWVFFSHKLFVAKMDCRINRRIAADNESVGKNGGRRDGGSVYPRRGADCAQWSLSDMSRIWDSERCAEWLISECINCGGSTAGRCWQTQLSAAVPLKTYAFSALSVKCHPPQKLPFSSKRKRKRTKNGWSNFSLFYTIHYNM